MDTGVSQDGVTRRDAELRLGRESVGWAVVTKCSFGPGVTRR
jgi:hypothetical protein